jgi:hypothetical protein
MNFCDIYELPAPRGRVPDTRINYANRCLAELKRLYQSPTTPLPPPPQPLQPWILTMNPAFLNILVQVLAPIAEGLLSAVLKHAGPQTFPMPPTAPSPFPPHATVPPTFPGPTPTPSPFPSAPMPPAASSLDWSQIAAMIAEEIAKLSQQGQQPAQAPSPPPHPIQQANPT